MKTLASLGINETAIIKQINCLGASKRRLLDLGIVNGTKIKALFKSPFLDPTAYLIKGTVIALRQKDCLDIIVY